MTRTPLSPRILSASGVVGWLAASTITVARTCVGVVLVDDLAEGGGDEHVAVELEELLVGDLIAGVGGVDHRAVRRRPVEQLGDVEARSGCRCRPLTSDTATTLTPSSCSARRPRADVAEALDGDAHRTEVDVPVVGGGLEHVDHPASGGGLAAGRAAEVERLAGDDGGGVAVAGREGVHHPRHHLGVGVDVGRGDVAVHAEHVADGVGEPPRHRLELAVAHAGRVDGDAALGATERQVEQRRLPRHQRRQGAHLVEVGGRVVADAALVRAAGAVVLHAVARERPPARPSRGAPAPARRSRGTTTSARRRTRPSGARGRPPRRRRG